MNELKMGMSKVSNTLYHASDGLSSSDLKELARSPLHWRTYKAQESESSAEMALGSLVHALILEPESVESEFAVGEFKIRRGKDYDAVLSQNPGRVIVSTEEFQEAKRISSAFFEECSHNPELKALTQGQKEIAFVWECPTTGVKLKCKPDILGNGFIADIKTSKDASFDAFQRQVVDYMYFLSAAHYLKGVTHVMQKGLLVPQVTLPPTAFYFIVIEKKAPYAIAVYRLDAKALEIGNSMVERAVNSYAGAVATDVWTGYPARVIEMGLPNYAFYKFNYMGE